MENNAATGKGGARGGGGFGVCLILILCASPISRDG